MLLAAGFDLVWAARVLGFVLWGFAMAQMLVINVAVWRFGHGGAPPPRLVPWHVSTISIYSGGFHSWATWVVFIHWTNHQHVTWRTPALVILGLIGNVAFLIVGRVVRLRASVANQVEKMTAGHQHRGGIT